MVKYHISDDGTPGRCTAKDLASCPKAAAGDSFHTNDYQEAVRESEQRFSANIGMFATKAKQAEAIEARSGDYTERFEAAAELYLESPTDPEVLQLMEDLEDEINSEDQAVTERIMGDLNYQAATAKLGLMQISQEDTPRGRVAREIIQAESELGAILDAQNRKLQEALQENNRRKESIARGKINRARGVLAGLSIFGQNLQREESYQVFAGLKERAARGETTETDLQNYTEEELRGQWAVGEEFKTYTNNLVAARAVQEQIQGELRRREPVKVKAATPKFELRRDNLQEAWGLLEAAGHKRPLNWEEMGSSEKDLWMEKRLARL